MRKLHYGRVKINVWFHKVHIQVIFLESKTAERLILPVFWKSISRIVINSSEILGWTSEEKIYISQSAAIEIMFTDRQSPTPHCSKSATLVWQVNMMYKVVLSLVFCILTVPYKHPSTIVL